MNKLFDSYNNIEKNIEFFELNQTLINAPELKKIIFLFRKCKNKLLERNDFKLWHQEILNPVSEYLFTITNSPLPFNYEKFKIRSIDLENTLNKSDQVENNLMTQHFTSSFMLDFKIYRIGNETIIICPFM